MAEETLQLAFRFPKALVERVDRHVERLSLAQPGVSITRADAVRSLLSQALDEVEKWKCAVRARR